MVELAQFPLIAAGLSPFVFDTKGPKSQVSKKASFAQGHAAKAASTTGCYLCQASRFCPVHWQTER
jgi:hypothetical protein